MAGAIFKGIGTLFVIVGILLLLAGGAAAGFSLYDQQQNEKQFISDPDRTDLNQMLLLNGGIGAGAGLLILIVGLVLTSIGGAQADARFRKDLLESNRSRAPETPTPAAPAPVEVRPEEPASRKASKGTRKRVARTQP
jgi:hypothetical protein